MINISPFRQLWSIFTKDQRRVAIFLLFYMLVGMALETLGIGLVIPILSLIIEPNYISQYPLLSPWIGKLGNPSHEVLVIISILLLVFIYLIKAMFLAFLVWRTTRFLYEFLANVSERLFSGYIYRPYSFHLFRNSAELIRNVIGQVNTITSVTQQSFLLLAEIMIITGISTLLLFIEPFGAFLVMFVFFCSSFVFHYFTKDRVLRWGKERQYHDGFRIQHAQQGFGGIKDIKILGREKGFIDQYKVHNIAHSKISQRAVVLQALPRLWTELLLVIGLAVLVLAVVFQGKSLNILLPILGVFAAAAFRLMPSVNRIIVAVQSIRYSMPVIKTIYDELNESRVKVIPSDDIPFNDELKFDRVSFSYPHSNNKAIDNVSIVIKKGTSIGIIGGSGSGKTTLIDIILGLFKPESGYVYVDGIDIQNGIQNWQKNIGYVPQSIYLSDDTLRSNIAFGIAKNEINDDAVWRAIRSAKLENYINELPDGIDTIVGERGVRISGGQCQRVGIARALYHNPSVLVLDEATSSLDTKTEAEIMSAIDTYRGEKTIITIAHRLSTVKNCDYIYRLRKGSLIEKGNSSVILENLN